MAKNYRISELKIIEKKGASVNNGTLTSTGVLNITPIKGRVISADSFSCATPLPHGVMRVRFLDTKTKNTVFNNVAVLVDFDTNFIVPNESVNILLDITGSSTQINSIGLESTIVLEDPKDSDSVFSSVTLTATNSSTITTTNNYIGQAAYNNDNLRKIKDRHVITCSSVPSNKRIKIAQLYFKADDGYYFLEKPKLQNNNNANDVVKLKLTKTEVSTKQKTKKQQITGYYFDVTLHDFSQEKQHLSLGGGRYQSMDFIIGLETKIENAIIGLIEGGIEDQETSDHLEELLEKRDIQGIVDYLIVPKEGPWSLDGNLSGDEKSKDKGGHHPRMASMDFQDLMMADDSTPEGKRSNWAVSYKGEDDVHEPRQAFWSSEGDRDDAWEDVDLIYGSGDVSSRYAAEEALIKYADIYTMIQNTKTWKAVWDQQKELPVFKNNPEAWQMFQRDIANQWAQDLFPINYDTFTDLTNSLQETFDKNALAYGHKPAASLTTNETLDHLRGEDSRPTFEESARSGELNQFAISDTLIDTIDDSVFTTILNPKLGQSLELINEIAKERYNLLGDDISQDALYSGDANSGKAKSVIGDDNFLSIMKNSDKISFLGLFMELEGGLSPSQVTEHFEFYGYLPAENKTDIMREVVKQRSKAEMVTTFTTMLADIYEKIRETNPDTYNAIRTRIDMDFDNSYEDASNDFIEEVLNRGTISKPGPVIEMVPIK